MVLNPAFKQADIMIRLRQIPDIAPARVRKIGSIGFAMFTHISTEKPECIIGMTSSRPPPQGGWVDDYARQHDLPIRYRLAEFFMRHAALGGCRAAALLPCFAGDREVHLRRVTEAIPELEEEAFLMVHQETDAHSKVHDLANAIGELFHTHASHLSGRSHTVQPPA